MTFLLIYYKTLWVKPLSFQLQKSSTSIKLIKKYNTKKVKNTNYEKGIK